MNNAKALVFDCNGTLFWDSRFNLAAWNEISLRYRGVPYSEEEMARLDGRTSGVTAAYFLGLPLEDPKVNEVVDEKEDLYARLCLTAGSPSLAPGAVELFDQAKKNGYLLAIATSAPKRNMDMYRAWWPVLDQMDVIVCDDGKRRGKPMPDIYLDTCKALGHGPRSVVVFEDSLQGVHAALSAQVDRVWQVVNDAKPAPIAGVRGRISDFREFIPFL